jgi:aromatic-L-amino-acid/L-tryptophan decarboxylase
MKTPISDSESLDAPPEEFGRLLSRASGIVLDRYANLGRPPHPGHSPAEVAAWFDEPLPQQGMDAFDLLDEVEEKIVDTAALNIGPNMYAYVMAGGNQLSMAGDLITSAVNQNVTKWHLAPAMTEMEKRVIQWTAEFIGYAPKDPAARAAPRRPPGGAIVSSGSAANLTGLNVGRNVFFERDGIRQKGLFGQAPYVVYASTETHNSIDKSMDVLGLGTDNLRRIPVDGASRMDPGALKEAIKADRRGGRTPFCVVGNAGTVNTGAIDPLEGLADICAAERLWFHVDGAYGGLAASLPELARDYAGLARADSVALDYHKWLYQPFEIGCTLVRDWDQMRRTFFRPANYLDSLEPESARFDINAHHFQLSRSGKALKVWMSFKAFGARKLNRMMRNDIQLRAYLTSRLADSPWFEVITDGPLAIATFRFVGRGGPAGRVDALNRAMVPALEQDQRVFLTGTKLAGRPVLRACIINHRKTREDIDFLVDVLTEVGLRVEAEVR